MYIHREIFILRQSLPCCQAVTGHTYDSFTPLYSKACQQLIAGLSTQRGKILVKFILKETVWKQIFTYNLFSYPQNFTLFLLESVVFQTTIILPMI